MMKKEFNPTIRIISLSPICTQGGQINLGGDAVGTSSEPYRGVGAPGRSVTPTTVNGVLGSVADQK